MPLIMKRFEGFTQLSIERSLDLGRPEILFTQEDENYRYLFRHYWQSLLNLKLETKYPCLLCEHVRDLKCQTFEILVTTNWNHQLTNQVQPALWASCNANPVTRVKSASCKSYLPFISTGLSKYVQQDDDQVARGVTDEDFAFIQV